MAKETLQINKTDARKAYQQAPKDLKTVLETLLGKSNLVPENITERVKTFEDACEVLGMQASETVKISTTAAFEHHANAAQALVKLRIIAEALNEGWAPDWSDSTQYKYYPWFKNTGSGFSFDFCVNFSQYSTVGSRLCFKNSELAEYAGKQFIDLYNQMFAL